MTEPVHRLAATVERLRDEVQEAHASADGRALVELAKGILVERLRCGPVQAAQQIEALAEQSGVSLLELAADIVNDVAADRLTETASSTVDRVRLRKAESGMLAAGDAQAVAQSLLEQALVPLGAASVAVWAVDSDTSLRLAGFAGFTPQEASRWRYVPPGVATPARRALAERRTVWLTDLAGAGLPSIGPAKGGRVAAPAAMGGLIAGILEIGWAQPLEPQPVAVRRQIEALAGLCAHTLHEGSVGRLDEDVARLSDLADGILDPALVLVPRLDQGRVADFRIHHLNERFVDPAGRPRSLVDGTLLLEAYPMAADRGGLFEKVEHVHATGEAFRAGDMAITTLVADVPVTVIADVSISRFGNAVLLIWRVQDETTRLTSLLQHAQRLGRIGGFDENVLTGEVSWNSQLFELYGLPPGAPPVPLDQLGTQAHPDDGPAISRFLRSVLHHRRSASTAFRLQRPDGIARHVRVIAEPVLDTDNRLLHVRGAYQDISAQHWTEVALAVTRDQLAQTEQHAAERDRLALQLQRAIMPSSPDPIDTFGLSIAVRYLPAESGALVGGDWYDAVVLPTKKILLSVGDIAGHGIDAATGMVVLRNALRGLATTGAGPGKMLTWLNLVAHHLTDSVMATAICGLYDPETRTLCWARAGHLPPVLVRDGRASMLPMPRGSMLGVVAEAEYEEAQFELEPADMLMLYTDGLIERRDRNVDEALEELRVLAETTRGPLEQRLDRLVRYSNADTDDDTCIVAVQLN
ncbi:SpoIIE family protein phosphatase [Kibdelosporangium persicum]|uniref:Magnesium or manganese-dependent protein phosphatase n=1 Tax=Kibdelosporangium persicum TaxID=2698649 RepID=A0ABX2F2G8_9PSEU|nr:SpoIIE family protein phosphatase [Kibdelosporangium persicum]NRN65528.1 Magnesium or manganese-dependent protein phosphatase [Kibdelosporangium persicum]